MQDMTSKWGREVAERGFAQIPNYLLQINQFVHEDAQLSPAELVLLLQLVGSWWKKDDLPFPSMRTLGRRANLSERQVQRALKTLEEKQYLIKVRSKVDRVISRNAYDLRPLTEILKTVAKHYANEHPRQIKGSEASGSLAEGGDEVSAPKPTVKRVARARKDEKAV